MVFTEAVYKLKEFYRERNSEAIKRNSFNYHNHRITIWYFEEYGFDIFQIEIINDDSIVFINNPIAFYNGEYHIDSWVPEKEYQALKYTLFKVDDWSPKPMYNYIIDIILEDDRMSYVQATKNELYENVQRSNHRTASEENLIYFSHLRTANVGKTIEKRLRRMMSFSEAQTLIDKLKKINKTLVFSDNPAESRDLYIAISKAEELILKK